MAKEAPTHHHHTTEEEQKKNNCVGPSMAGSVTFFVESGNQYE